MSQHPLLILAFIPFLVFMYRIGLKRMKELSAQSVFNPANIRFDTNSETSYNQDETSGRENS
jgi:hypothetical protein